MAAEIFTATKQTTFKDQITGVLADGLKVGKASYGGSGDASAMTIAAYDVTAAQAGSVYGLNVAGPVSTTALITNAITTYIAAPTKTGTGTITNSYSLKLAAPAGAGTDNYSLWAVGNAKIDGTSILLGTSASGATTATVGGAFTGNTLKIAGVAANNTAFISLTTDVTTGIVNIFDSLTGTANIVKAATTINIGSAAAAAATLTVGGTITGNTLKIGGTAGGTISLTTDVTNGTVNIFDSLTGTANIVKAATTINIGSTAAAPTMTLGGGTTAAATLVIGGGLTGNTIKLGSANNGSISLTTDATSTAVNIFTAATGAANIMTGSIGTITIGGSGSTTVIGGNLTVNGTVTTINSNTLTVDDKNIELGSVAAAVISSATHTIGTVTGTGTAGDPWTATISNMSTTTGLIVGSAITAVNGATAKLYGGTPTSVLVSTIVSSTSITYQVTGGTTPVAGTDLGAISTGAATDVTANGAGLTVLGTSPKTLNWVSATTAWTSSENFDLATGKKYKIGTNDALSTTALTLSDALAVPASVKFTTVTRVSSSGNTITTSASVPTIVFTGALTTDGLEVGMGMTISGASASTYTAGTYIVSIDSATQFTVSSNATSNGGAQPSGTTLTFGMKAASQIITLPSATSSVATLALAETLQNKTLAGLDRNKSRINFSFDQGGTNALTLNWAGANAQSITFPNASGTLLTTLTGLALNQGTSGDSGNAGVMGVSVLRFGNYTLRGKTTDTTAVRLTYTGAAYSSGGTIPVAAKTTVNANINISAYDSSNNKSASWQITATFARQAGNVILLGDPLVTASSDAEMASCSVDIDPDTTANSLQLQCAGNGSKTIYWAAAITTIEITGV